jgi:excisionase family DNA binding protein
VATIETPRLLTPAEVAYRLRVGRATVYRLISSGESPAVRLNARQGPLRVAEDELCATLGKRKPPIGKTVTRRGGSSSRQIWPRH